MRPRTIAIGDIHGCSQALKDLIEAIKPRPEDLLVTLGDYINRGPDSRGVLDQLIALEQNCPAKKCMISRRSASSTISFRRFHRRSP
jgi:predicted phosphodiesterase